MTFISSISQLLDIPPRDLLDLYKTCCSLKCFRLEDIEDHALEDEHMLSSVLVMFVLQNTMKIQVKCGDRQWKDISLDAFSENNIRDARFYIPDDTLRRAKQSI
jgi:hypothetical protein